jgi:hypothetical protein
MRLALFCGLVVMAQAAGAAAPAPVVVACTFPLEAASGGPATPTVRTFRISAGSFQEWDADLKAFGGNLCQAYACVRAAGRMEGTIGSASVTYTVGIVSGGGAYWRAAGATRLASDHGACRILPAPPR